MHCTAPCTAPSIKYSALESAPHPSSLAYSCKMARYMPCDLFNLISEEVISFLCPPARYLMDYMTAFHALGFCRGIAAREAKRRLTESGSVGRTTSSRRRLWY